MAVELINHGSILSVLRWLSDGEEGLAGDEDCPQTLGFIPLDDPRRRMIDEAVRRGYAELCGGTKHSFVTTEKGRELLARGREFP